MSHAFTPADITAALNLTVALCQRFEGVYLRPYLCPAGVPTVGVGSTLYEDGTQVALADPPITRERAFVLLRTTLARDYLPAVLHLCPGIDTPERLAALTDFAYNCGVGALRASNLRRRVNAGDWDAVPAELAKWVKGGGRVLAGLVRRREAEAELAAE